MSTPKPPTLASVRALAKSRGLMCYIRETSTRGWWAYTCRLENAPPLEASVHGLPTRAIALRALAAALREMPEVKPIPSSGAEGERR